MTTTITRHTSGVGSSSKSQTITPSDSVNFPHFTRAIYVGGAGDVNVVYPNGATQVFPACPVGMVLAVEAIRVNSTSTTATNLVAMF